MSKKGKTNDSNTAEGLSAGMAKHFPDPKQSLTFGGGSYTVAAIDANLQKISALRTATMQAQTAAHDAVAAEKAQLPALLLFMRALVAFVKVTFGNSATALADFELQTKKARTPPTAEQLAAAKAKRKATREARGTKGSKQKKLVKGNVTGVVVTPITAPEPAAAPAPAAAAIPPPAPAAAPTPPKS